MKRKNLYIFLSFLSVLLVFDALKAQVLDYSTLIQLENGRKKIIKKFLIQINDKESNDLAHVEVEHSSSQKFSLIKANVIDSKGNIVRKLRKKDILTKSDRSYETFFQDDWVEEFDLYWNEYPYRMEYVYQIVENEFIYVAAWHPLVTSQVATLNSSLRVEVPLNYQISTDYSENIHFKQIVFDNKKILEWNCGEQKIPDYEIYPPPLHEILSHVFVVPHQFEYGTSGSTSSWRSFGQWYVELNQGADELPLSEKTIIDRLIDGISDSREIISVLYHYLQEETKYVNVSIEVGGLKSYPATYVCENKYGDCKALTTYMHAMLKYAGINSYPALVQAGSNAVEINKDFPGQQFSHVMLLVPIDEDTIWLENTSSTTPLNYLSTFYQNRMALMVRDGASQLVRTPTLTKEDVLEKRFYEFVQNSDKSWTVSILKRLKGEAFEKYLYYKTHLGQKDQMEEVTSDISLDLFEVEDWDIRCGDREDTEIEVYASGHCRSPLSDVGQWLVIYPLQIKVPDFEAPEKRNLEVKINFPVNKSDSLIFDLSQIEGREMQIPKSINLTNDFGSYSATYQIADNTLTVTENFFLKSGDYSLAPYPAFYSFINAVKNHKKSSAIIIK